MHIGHCAVLGLPLILPISKKIQPEEVKKLQKTQSFLSPVHSLWSIFTEISLGSSCPKINGSGRVSQPSRPWKSNHATQAAQQIDKVLWEVLFSILAAWAPSLCQACSEDATATRPSVNICNRTSPNNVKANSLEGNKPFR